jgi:hypothetical protein
MLKDTGRGRAAPEPSSFVIANRSMTSYTFSVDNNELR